MFHYLFGLDRLSAALLDIIFILLLLNPSNKYYKHHVVIYLFCIFLLIKSLVVFSGAELGIESFYIQFSFFRRVALPFAVFIFIAQRLIKSDSLDEINDFLYKWFIAVIVLQTADFFLMNTVTSYHDLMVNMANAVEEYITNPEQMTTHFPILDFEPIRCFGIGLNYHSSGLYSLLLYAYNMKMRQSLPVWVHIFALIASLANGSLQFLGLYFLLWLLRIDAIYKYKFVILTVGSLSIILLLEVIAETTLPIVGTVYMFEYAILVWQAIVDYYTSHMYELLIGVGGLQAAGKLWSFGGDDFELGDIGVVRLFIEGGLIAFLLYFLVIGWLLIKYVLPYKGREPLPVVASVVTIIIGIFSLLHYPVLFSRNNVVLYMLFLAIIATQRTRERGRLGRIRA